MAAPARHALVINLKALPWQPMDASLLQMRANHRIRVISADGATVSTYAGNGVRGFCRWQHQHGTLSWVQSALPWQPMDASLLQILSIDRIRVISADGATVSTYAGTGFFGFANGERQHRSLWFCLNWRCRGSRWTRLCCRYGSITSDSRH